VVSLPLTTDKTYEFRVLARDLFEQQVGTGQVEWAGEAEVASNIVSATPVDKLDATADKPTGDQIIENSLTFFLNPEP